MLTMHCGGVAVLQHAGWRNDSLSTTDTGRLDVVCIPHSCLNPFE